MKQLILSFLSLIVINVAWSQGEFFEHTHRCEDGAIRPYTVYVPSSIDDSKDRILLTYLHGAITNKDLRSDPLAYMKRSKLIQMAEEGGFVLMFSFGQKGATWFDEVGVKMVLAEVDQTTKNYKIDPDRRFLTGFSDGGSGTLYFALNHSDKFAGFIAMNGHFKVAAQLGDSQGYPENMNGKPLLIFNTKGDLLYPAEKLVPIIDHLKTYNGSIEFRNLEGGHDLNYLPEESKRVLQFLMKHRREVPYRISWETSNLRAPGIHWLSIESIDSTRKRKSWHQNKNLELFNDKADFGIKYDYSYQGRGLKVAAFKSDESVGKRMGIKSGDVILLMEQDTMNSPYSPYFYLATKKAGEKTNVTVLRGDEEITLNGTFNEGFNYFLYNYSRSSGKVIAELKKGVLKIQTSRVSGLRIDLSKLPIDPKANLVIQIDDKEVFRGIAGKESQLLFDL